MKFLARITLALFVVAVIAVGGGYIFYKKDPANASKYGGLALNFLKTLNAPDGTIVVERNPNYQPNTQLASANGTPRRAATALSSSPTSNPDRVFAATSDVAVTNPTAGQPLATEWASYNRTPDGNRFSPLDQINTANVGDLKVRCTYDVGGFVAFETGPIMVNGALIVTTEKDTISLNPDTCKQNWRVHENVPSTELAVNRGAAYMGGMLFRGLQNGDVVAYDFGTGRKLWTTAIADMKAGESVPSAPIAWNGMVFAGNAGGDNKGVKGRMYGLDAKTGKIRWEFYLVPYQPGDKVRGPLANSPLDGTTWQNDPGVPISGGGTWTNYTLDPATGTIYVPGGNPAPDFAMALRKGENLFSGSVVALDAMTGKFKKGFLVTNHDWHDWDVSNTPALIKTRAGHDMLVVTPKDGFLYGFDMHSAKRLFRTSATTIFNIDERFAPGKKVRFCPGTTGGAEWNSPVYIPTDNLVLTGQVDWCYSVTLKSPQKIINQPMGKPWSGMATINPLRLFGNPLQDDDDWGGWVYAVNPDTGTWAWRAHLNYPVVAAITPTAGGVTFFGDVGGNLYAVDSKSGRVLLHRDLGHAIGGGIIAYQIGGKERIAVTGGLTNPVWPTKPRRAEVVVMGLGNG